MAIVSAGYAGTVNDSQWALMSRFFGQDFGILNLGELNCTNPAGTKNFNLSAGTLYGRGVMDVSDAVVNVAPTVPVSGGQWFLIVARRVWATKTTSFIALPGPTTTTATPTARPAAYPAMQRNPGVQDDQPLWWVWVNASNTTTVRFDQRIFSNGRVADFGAIPPTGFLTRGSQLTVESVRMTIVDDGTAWKPITMRVSGTTAQRNEATAAGMVAEGMEWRDTTDNSDYVSTGGSWVAVLPGPWLKVLDYATGPLPAGRLRFNSGWSGIVSPYWDGVWHRSTPSGLQIMGAVVKSSAAAALEQPIEATALMASPVNSYIPSMFGAASGYSVITKAGSFHIASPLGSGVQLSFGGFTGAA